MWHVPCAPNVRTPLEEEEVTFLEKAGVQESTAVQSEVSGQTRKDLPEESERVEQLVAASKSGDVEAFGLLVEQYQNRVFRVAYSITQNLQDAEDAVQTTFLKALSHLSEFRGSARFSTWLTKIAVNESLMQLRHRRVRGFTTSIEDPDREAPAFQLRDEAPGPEELCGGSEVRKLVLKALQTLRPALRIVFVLRDLEEFTNGEVAQALGLTEACVKTRIMRARQALRKLLEPLISVSQTHSLLSNRRSEVI